MRRTKDAFRQHIAESDSSKIQELLSRGNIELQMLKVSLWMRLPRSRAGNAMWRGTELLQEHDRSGVETFLAGTA